jgi:transcription initiation factor IIE alpha subunit
MSSYERQDASVNDGVLAETTNDTLVPYQPHTLQEFVGQVGRLFYDDACIVLLDFLAREQRSFQESDLRDLLGWRETLIHQKLYLLNKHLLITQDLGTTRGNGRAPVYWRISDHIFSAVQFRYQQVLDRLTKLVEDATNQHEFQCSNPSCSLRHTALDVASCSRSLEDEHPLCLRCGSRLETSVRLFFSLKICYYEKKKLLKKNFFFFFFKGF